VNGYGAPGGAGGVSSFGAVFTANSGALGTASYPGPNTPGVSGAPGGYTITSTPTSTSLTLPSPTASPFLLYGIRGSTGYGLGGGAGSGSPGGGSAGGAGTAGFVIVEEFY
jgi:hypothetical protein